MKYYDFEEAKNLLIETKKVFLQKYKKNEEVLIFDIKKACFLGKLPENFDPNSASKYEVYIYFDHFIEADGRGYRPNEYFYKLELGIEIFV